MQLAILDDYQNVALTMADWDSLQPTVTVRAFDDSLVNEDALAARLRDFEMIVAMRERTPFRRSLLERLPHLKLLITTGMRNASIDTQAATERGVVVCGTGGLPYPTAELAWGLILGLARNIAREDAGMRQGGWQRKIGVGLHGKTLGVIGLGNLGGQVATYGKAFQMEVIAWSENLKKERADSLGVERVDKNDLFRRADFVTIHLQLSQRTAGLVGPAELTLMKPSAFLVNTSRGPIVDERGLLAALANRQIAGAALDVYDCEPLPSAHPLRLLENVLLTPHIGFVTRETYRVFYRQALEDVHSFLAGKPLRVLSPE